MSAPHLIAYVILVWWITANVWQLVDNPVERVWNSKFYMLCVGAVEILLVVLALVILL